MQKLVNELTQKYDLKSNHEIRYMDLVSEIGELGKELIKGCAYGAKPYENSSEIELEIGDCLFSLIALSSELGIDIETALNKVILKYTERFELKGNIGSEGTQKIKS